MDWEKLAAFEKTLTTKAPEASELPEYLQLVVNTAKKLYPGISVWPIAIVEFSHFGGRSVNGKFDSRSYDKATIEIAQKVDFGIFGGIEIRTQEQMQSTLAHEIGHMHAISFNLENTESHANKIKEQINKRLSIS